MTQTAETRRPLSRRGFPHRKLSAGDVYWIRGNCNAYTADWLCKEFRISRSTLWRIVTHRTWKQPRHVAR